MHIPILNGIYTTRSLWDTMVSSLRLAKFQPLCTRADYPLLVVVGPYFAKLFAKFHFFSGHFLFRKILPLYQEFGEISAKFVNYANWGKITSGEIHREIWGVNFWTAVTRPGRVSQSQKTCPQSFSPCLLFGHFFEIVMKHLPPPPLFSGQARRRRNPKSSYSSQVPVKNLLSVF